MLGMNSVGRMILSILMLGLQPGGIQTEHVWSMAVILAAPQDLNVHAQLTRPNSDVDVRAYGARTANISGIASCKSGQAIIELSDAYPFVNGDGVTIYGCGLESNAGTLSAPTVATGNTRTFTVPEANLTSARGNFIYSYLGVPIDKGRGIGLPSPATQINNGLPLGQQSASVISATLTGNALRLVFAVAPNIANGALFHFFGSTNAFLSGYYNVSATTATTLTASPVAPNSGSTIIRTTGGSIIWFNGNQLTFAATSKLDQIAVCSKRPGDVSYHLIGLTHPYVSGNNDIASLVFTDWGSPVTTAAFYPSYISDSICTAVSAVPQQLTTTIVSGAGTRTLAVAHAAKSTNSGVNIYHDNGPNMTAADSAAHAINGVVYIPFTGANASFRNYSPVTFNSSLKLAGNLEAVETITLNNNIQGTLTTPGGQFQWSGSSYIHDFGAFPVVRWTAGASYMRDLTIYSNGSNQTLLLMWGTSNGYQVMQNVQMATTSPNDYSSMASYLVPAGGGFNYRMSYVSMIGGPNQNADSSWVPIMEVPTAQPQIIGMDDINLAPRGIYFGVSMTQTPWFAAVGARHIYNQGPIMPSIAAWNVPGFGLYAEDVFHDTSSIALYAVLNLHPSNIEAHGLNMASSEPGGFPLPYTGEFTAVPRVDISGSLPSDDNITPYGSGINKQRIWSPLGIFGAFSTMTNCASSTSPAACASAPEGAVVIAAGHTSVVVDTTLVTANSNIAVTFDSSIGSRLGVTCNTTPALPTISARSVGKSFTISVASAPSSNPACFTFRIGN